MTDILLTHSYHLFYDAKQVRKMQPYPPLGTLYAAALLRERGFSVAVFDSMLEDPERGFPEALRRHQPRIVAIYEDNFNFLSKMCLTRMRQVAYGMIGAAQRAGASVVVNGSDASDHVTDYLQKGADVVLLGEAEWSLLELTECLLGEAGGSIQDIQGLAFFDRSSGRVHRTPARPLMKDPDALPFPARDLVDLARYRDAWKMAHGFFSLNVVASRGCPFRCNWCAKPIYGDSFHLRSAERVAEEMRALKSECGAEHLWFADDIFGLRARWVQELADRVEELNAAVPFKMQSRVDLMKPATVRALARSGCVEAWLGVESGSQKILDAMEKGTRVDQIASARGSLRENRIRACYFLQFGYPGETWADIRKTIELVRMTRPDDIGVSVSYPLPGTRFYDRVREELGAKLNWEDSGDLAMMFKGAYTSEFYRALHDAMHAELDAHNAGSPWRFSLNPQGDANAVKDSRTIEEMWARVEKLEKTCRNTNPTLLPVLTCSMAGSC
ncbi:MAG TPA: radical SAM protein [Terriglobia bacterium]|nr:radical SAM protein [Terriglobia bacterium]